MNLQTKKLTIETLQGEEFYQFAELERAGRRNFSSRDYLMGLMKRHDVYACFEGNEMAAYILIIPDFCYLSRSIFIDGIQTGWKYNTDAVVEYLIRSALAFYPSDKQDDYVTVEVDRHHEPNIHLLRRIGFKESLIRGRMGKNYVVLFCEHKALIE